MYEGDLRVVADAIPALIAMMTPAGEVESINRHALEYLGGTVDVLKRWASGEVVHPDDLPGVVAAWKRSTATGRPYDIEHRIRRADGVYRWFHVRGMPIRGRNGQIARWCVLQTDIDDRKRGEALLAEEKRFLEMVARGTPMPTILAALCHLVEGAERGCHCSVLLVDPSGARLEHGAAPSLPASFIASMIGGRVHVEGGPCAMAASLNEQVIASDLRIEARWAESGWCELAMSYGLLACWSTPIPSSTGKVLGTFAIHYHEPNSPTELHHNLIERFTHIASIAVEKARSEAALRQSEALLREAQHLSSTGSWYWRVELDTVEFSEQTCRIYGFETGSTVTLEMIASRIHPEDIPLLREMIEIARGPASDLDYRYRVRMPDGTVKHLHLVAHGTRDRDGELEYIGAIQDVTQRHLAEEALGKARSELAHVTRVTTLGAMTASIAHEVSQPLSGIVTNSSTCLRMLSADPPNVEGAKETVRRTIRDGHRASEVITRLRALFGKKGSVDEPVDLNDAAREVIALSWNELQSSRVVARTELAAELPAVRGDRVQLQQVMLNLILNAVDAMSGVEDQARQLVIRTEVEEGEGVRLSVQDAGVGLEPEAMERLFEAFYTTKRNGMGMGLSVSRSIIEGHRGRIWATPNQGKGATFSFAIPRAPASEPVEVDPGSLPRSGGTPDEHFSVEM